MNLIATEQAFKAEAGWKVSLNKNKQTTLTWIKEE
ncbi:hypothetical protein J2S02_000318 [Metabacillus niabensis]|uniref:Uncharacterized protein n=1 Tax=Metabacillus niabensis TaxID=324854 RepID=A0ABT9YVH2_9BACI|nr:hypothetical protein [Metabacillus niabensis]